MSFLQTVVVYYFLYFNYAYASCPDGCTEPTLFYEELNCKPVFNSSSSCCPTHFDCTQMKETFHKKCQFRGKFYNIGESLNDDKINENCKADCLCREGYDGKAEFECASVDCPEWLGYEPNDGCYLTYQLDKCCSVGQLCRPFNMTCKVSDKTYREGEKFYPSDLQCTKCICQKGFQGKFIEPFCKKEKCGQEIIHQKQIYGFCAPSYISLSSCCPYSWICPKKTDRIVSVGEKSSGLKKCRFGHEELDVGSSFTRTSENGGELRCECRIPPYLTCVQNYEYSP